MNVNQLSSPSSRDWRIFDDLQHATQAQSLYQVEVDPGCTVLGSLSMEAVRGDEVVDNAERSDRLELHPSEEEAERCNEVDLIDESYILLRRRR